MDNDPLFILLLVAFVAGFLVGAFLLGLIFFKVVKTDEAEKAERKSVERANKTVNLRVVPRNKTPKRLNK